MTRIVTRGLKEEKDGIQGFIAYPERAEKGPGLLLIHQHSGLTGYLKTAAYNFAQLGYTTVVPNLYHMLGYPAETHIDKGTEIQNKTPDPDFVRVIDRGWRYCLSRNDVDGSRVGVVGYCMGGRLGIHFVAATPAARAFRRVLSLGARRTTDEDPPAPSVRRGAGNQMPFHDSLRRPRSAQHVSGAAAGDGKLSLEWPVIGVALFSFRLSWFRFHRIGRLPTLSRRSRLAVGDGVFRARVDWAGTLNFGVFLLWRNLKAPLPNA